MTDPSTLIEQTIARIRPLDARACAAAAACGSSSFLQAARASVAAAIAEALLSMAAQMQQGKAGGVYHFSGAPDVSWADFVREIFTRSGLSPQVVDIPTSAYPTPARRPLNSRLDCTAITRDFGIARPDWRTGLAAVITELDA